MIYYLSTIDSDHLANEPYDVRHKVEKVEPCGTCGALVLVHNGFQHEEWHRQNDIEVDTGNM